MFQGGGLGGKRFAGCTRLVRTQIGLEAGDEQSRTSQNDKTIASNSTAYISQIFDGGLPGANDGPELRYDAEFRLSSGCACKHGGGQLLHECTQAAKHVARGDCCGRCVRYNTQGSSGLRVNMGEHEQAWHH